MAGAKVQTIPLKLDGVRVVLTRKHRLVLGRWLVFTWLAQGREVHHVPECQVLDQLDVVVAREFGCLGGGQQGVVHLPPHPGVHHHG